MQPTEIYLKSKRNMLLASGVLLLILFSGVEIRPGSYEIAGMELTFKDTSYLDTIISIILLFFFIQCSLYWATQKKEVRSLIQYRIDGGLSFLVSVMALLAFAYYRLVPQSIIERIGTPDNIWFEIIAVMLGWFLAFSARAIIFRFVEASRRVRKNVEDASLQALLNNRWNFVFNPAHPTKGHKVMTFNADGTIGEGRNHNEDTWRVRGEFLEILNSNQQIYSRFKFHPMGNTFDHTNDDDTLSLHFQRIEPIGPIEPEESQE